MNATATATSSERFWAAVADPQQRYAWRARGLAAAIEATTDRGPGQGDGILPATGAPDNH